MTNHQIYNVVLQQEDIGYSVSVPSLPGCFSQGDNFEETIKNIREAIELYLEDKNNQTFQMESKKEFMVPVVLRQKYA